MKNTFNKFTTAVLLAALSLIAAAPKPVAAQLNQGNLHLQLTQNSATKGQILRWTDKLILQLLTSSTEGDDENLSQRFAALSPKISQSVNLKPSVYVRQYTNKRTHLSYYYVSFTCAARDAMTNRSLAYSSCTLRTQPVADAPIDDPYTMNPAKEEAIRSTVITGMGQILGKLEERFAHD